jgi:hypothetical protein
MDDIKLLWTFTFFTAWKIEQLSLTFVKHGRRKLVLLEKREELKLKKVPLGQEKVLMWSQTIAGFQMP